MLKDIEKSIGEKPSKQSFRRKMLGLTTSALLLAGCGDGQAKQPDNKLITSHANVAAKLSDTHLMGKLLGIHANTKLNIDFQDCKHPAVYYSLQRPDIAARILHEFAKEKTVEITKPSSIGVDCQSISTTLPQHVSIYGLDFDSDGKKFAEYEYDTAIPVITGVSSDLAKARSLQEILNTPFRRYIHVETGTKNVTVDVDFDSFQPR